MPEIDRNSTVGIGRDAIRKEIAALEKCLANLGDPFWKTANHLLDCRGIVWVTAVGTSAAVGERFAHILTCAGVRSMFLSPLDGLHGHTRVFQPQEVLIAMSRGGESHEVNQMVAIANQLGLTTIAFVNNPESTLAKSSSLVLPIQSDARDELKGVLATTSTVVYSAVCDALCAVVAEAKGFDPQSFGQVHPGGAVGKALSS